MGDSDKRRILRQQRREAEICILCGKNKPKEGAEACTECTKKRGEYQKQNREKFNRYNKVAREKVRLEVLNAYGGKCECCGEEKQEFLTLDHKNKDGKEHREEIGTSSFVLYLWARKNNYPDSLRIYCFNCNLGSAIYGECPHRKYDEKRENTRSF